MRSSKVDDDYRGNEQHAPRLKDKRAAFVREYLVDKNATQAAIRAGYSKKTATSIGEELLRFPDVRAAVEAGLSDLAAKVGLTAERVLRERMRLAFFDPRKLLDDDGNPLPLQQLDDDTVAAIAGLDVAQMSVSGDASSVVSQVKKYKLASKDTNLAALEKYLGLNEKPLRMSLGKVSTAADCAQAQAAVVDALARGDLLPSQAQVVSGLIDAQRRAIETMDIVARIAALEEQIRPRAA